MWYEYEFLERREERVEVEYIFNGYIIGYSLYEAINFLGKDGWELVGEIDEKIVMKRRHDKEGCDL